MTAREVGRVQAAPDGQFSQGAPCKPVRVAVAGPHRLLSIGQESVRLDRDGRDDFARLFFEADAEAGANETTEAAAREQVP